MRYSLDQLNAIERFSELVELLETEARSLKHLLLDSQVLGAKAFEIARVSTEDESQSMDFIPVESFDGNHAVKAILHAFTDWYGEPGFSTRYVHRTPGALVIQTGNPQSILDAVARCNHIKAALEEEASKMGKPNDRFGLIHSHHHMMVQLQLTRKITALLCPPDIQSVTFSWGFKTEIKKLTIEQACDMIGRLRDSRDLPLGGDTPWPSGIDEEIHRMQSLPVGTEFRLRRMLNVRPQANIRYRLSEEEQEARRKVAQKGGKVKQPTIAREAHSPIIILNPQGDVKLRDLKDYSRLARSDRKERSGGITAKEPFTPLAPIYQVLSPRQEAG